MTSFNLDYLLKAPFPNAVTFRVKASTYEFVGDTIHRWIPKEQPLFCLMEHSI